MVKPTLVQSLLNRPTQTYHFPHSKEYHSSKQDFIRASTQIASPIDRGYSELVPGPSPPMHPQDTHNNSNNGHVRSSTASMSSYHSVPSSSVSSLSAVTAASSPSQPPSMRPDTAKQSHHTTPDTKRTPRSVASSASNRNAQLPEIPTIPVTSQPKRMTSPPSAYNRQQSSKPIQSQSKQQRSPSQPPLSQKPPAQSKHDSDAEGDDEDDESDVFYTPRSSLYSSPRTSRASANVIVDQKAITSALAPVIQTRARSARASRSSASGSRTPSTASILSIPSTASSSSLGDLGSIIPSSFGTNSTRLTSPLFSDNGGVTRHVLTNGQAQSRQPQKSNSVETITIASSSPSKKGSQSSSSMSTATTTTTTFTQQASQQQQSTPPRGRPRPLSATSNNRKRRNQAETPPQTYADEDWAKDVRWLAPAIREVPSVPSPRNNYRPMSSEGAASPRASANPSRTYAAPQKTYPPAAKSAERRQRSSRHSRGSRSSRGRMSALMEEDESDFSDLTPGASSQESRPPSPVMEEVEGGRSRSVTPTASSGIAVRSTVTRSHSAKVPKTTVRTITSSPEPIAEAKSGAPSIAATSETEDSLELNPDARLRAYARSPGGSRRTYSHTRPLSRSSTLTQTTFAANSMTDPSIFAKGLPTHALPTPFPTTASASTSYSSGANYNGGYTGLTMAHAGYVNKGKATLNDGKVDLARAGIAQSSMATVEVVRGVAQAQTSSNTSSPRKKRRALSFSFKALGSVVVGKARGKGKNKEETPSHLLDALPLPVAFTAHIPPPSYVPSSYVLLQVFAVGLDALDSLLVQEKINSGVGAGTGKGKNSSGYIPGRSLVGRVIECGWDVKGDVCKKGEWVIGLLDVKKSGALAEFIVIERHRLHRAPQPRSRPTTLFPSAAGRRSHVRSASLPAHLHTVPSHTNILAPAWNPLTVEELSLLALSALPAHRAVRTFADVIAPPKINRSQPPIANGDSSKPSCCALVLGGSDGPGAMAIQILSRRGVRITVQVFDSAVRSTIEDEELHTQTEDESPTLGLRRNLGKQPERSPSKPKTLYERVEARLKAWGAAEICVGEPIKVIERLAEDGRAFDAVLDTVGGADIWEMSQRLLLADPAYDTVRNPPTSPVSPADSSISAAASTRSTITPKRNKSSRGGSGGISQAQFTTLMGDNPARPIPSAHDNFRSGFRSLKRSVSRSAPNSANTSPTRTTVPLPLSPSRESFSFISRKNSLRGGSGEQRPKKKRIVNYTWVSVSADVDFEGEDVRDSLGAVVGMVEEGWIRPWVGEEGDGQDKIVPFEKSPEVFKRDAAGPVGLLRDGGTCVVKIAG